MSTLLFAQLTGDGEGLVRTWWSWLGNLSGRAVEVAWSPTGRLCLAVAVASIGIWLMLPARHQRVRAAGGFLALLGALTLFSLLPPLGWELASWFFWPLAAVALSAALATITCRSPVYAAMWFALALFAVAGLMVLNGAQFVGVATIAVYAGAIVVTFLFVLMLAQPEGHSFYDRVSWGTTPAAMGIVAGMLFAAATTWAVLDVAPAAAPPAAGQSRQVLAAEHVAALGGELFGPQLVLVEVAGVLLLAALVGAVAMAFHGAHEWAQVRRAGALWERGSDHE